MKTNWEKEIKKQLKNREMEVSDATRERFEVMMQGIKAPRKPKLRFAWAIAAAVLLLAGIVSISQLMSEGNSEVTGETIVTPIVQTEETSDFPEHPQLSKEPDSRHRNAEFRQMEPIAPKKERIHSDLPTYTQVKNQETLENESYSESTEKVTIKENTAVQEDSLARWEESLLSSSELPQETETKTSYTDPELLLYSVENDEVIKQKRTGARIVVIDFNK